MSTKPYPATFAQLLRDRRDRLQQLCRAVGLAETGTKSDLAERYAAYLKARWSVTHTPDPDRW